MRSTEHLCPRRRENPIANQVVQGFDSWVARDGYRCCSYCGSIHPDDVFMAVAENVEFGPTDKSYKVYVHLPNPKAGQTIQVGSESGPAYNIVTGEPNKPDLTLWERVTGRYDRKIMGKASATLFAKFYFQHFDDEQQQRFINLLNARAVNIGFPGHFYALPFFIKRGE
jgi:hypothetical protein